MDIDGVTVRLTDADKVQVERSPSGAVCVRTGQLAELGLRFSSLDAADHWLIAAANHVHALRVAEARENQHTLPLRSASNSCHMMNPYGAA